MKKYFKLIADFLTILPGRNKERGTVAAWAGVIVAAGSAAYGISQSSKAQKGNQALAGQAREDELARREAVAGEIAKAMEEYNKLREQRPGLTVQEWIKDRVAALDDPKLKEVYRRAKKEDFMEAQFMADMATKQNLNLFELALDRVSGGDAMKFLKKRNELALTETTADAYKRALELQSSAIPAGSVQMNQDGALVRGQRADKQLFNTAYEVDTQIRDRQFRMLKDILNDDRVVAERQQDRAKEFLQFNDFAGYGTQVANAAMQNRINFQMQDEQNQFDLIKMFYGAAMVDQTATPQFRSTAGYDALTAQGIDAAIKGIGNIVSSNKQTSNYTPSYNQYGQATVDGTPVRDMV